MGLGVGGYEGCDLKPDGPGHEVIPDRKGSSHTKLTLPLSWKILEFCSSPRWLPLASGKLKISSTSRVESEPQPVAL